MKTLGGLTLSILVATLGLSMLPGIKASAACSNTDSYGSVELFVPELPKDGVYAVWVRMQSPEKTARVLLEVNNETCLEIQSTDVAPNQWAWQSYNIGNKPQPIRFANTDGNSIKIIGVQAGVKVDKAVLTKPDCVPVEIGANCANAVELSSTPGQGPVSTASLLNGEPLKGNVILSGTPQRYENKLVSVSYTVNGRTIQTSDSATPFDSTLVANGRHTVLIETLLDDGRLYRESVTIDVRNPENPISPLIRWVRINQSAIQTAALIAGALAVTILFVGIIKRWYLKRRELHFHGF